MIILTLLICFPIVVSAVPVSSNVRASLHSPRGGDAPTQSAQTVEAANQKPEAPPLAPFSPSGQPQAGVVQQPDPLQQYTWYPQGGSAVIAPMQPSFYGSRQLTMPQQPLIFPPYGYLPMFSSPYGNQLFPPYGHPMILESALPQIPANQLPSSPVLPAENAAGAVAPLVDATLAMQLQQQQQQQNPQIVYMLQQPMSSPLGSLSSEELRMAATVGQLGVYVPTVLSNQPESHGAGLRNPDQQGVQLAVGGQKKRGLPCSGSQTNASGVPAALAGAAPDATTAQTPARPHTGNPRLTRMLRV